VSGQAASASCEYELDPLDRLAAVDDAWIAFARDNGAPSLVPPGPMGRSVFDYISDPTTAEFYHAIFARVRKTGLPATLPFRCDAPALRRFLSLHIAPRQDGSLRLQSTVTRVEPRAPAAWADHSGHSADEPLLRMCSWCKSINVGSEWLEIEEAVTRLGLFEGPARMVTHGICPACDARLRHEFDRDQPL